MVTPHHASDGSYYQAFQTFQNLVAIVQLATPLEVYCKLVYGRATIRPYPNQFGLRVDGSLFQGFSILEDVRPMQSWLVHLLHLQEV
jgi:hypothetical protein